MTLRGRYRYYPHLQMSKLKYREGKKLTQSSSVVGLGFAQGIWLLGLYS